LRACAWPGLTGVIVSRLESAQQVAEADGLLAELEARRGILHGTLEIVAVLETARGNHAAYDIGRASPRIESAGADHQGGAEVFVRVNAATVQLTEGIAHGS
jgi:citrate lyase beta subunit